MEVTGTKASENVRGSIKIVPGEVPPAGQYRGQRQTDDPGNHQEWSDNVCMLFKGDWDKE